MSYGCLLCTEGDHVISLLARRGRRVSCYQVAHMSNPSRTSHKRKAPPPPGLHRSQPHQGTNIVISSDRRRILKNSHRFSTSSTPVPHEPPLPPPRIVEPEEELSSIRDDPFFQSYNENHDENNNENVIVCDVPTRYQVCGAHFCISLKKLMTT